MEEKKKKLRPFPKPSADARKLYGKGSAASVGWKRIMWIYLACLPFAAGVFWFMWIRQAREDVKSVPILMYHRVATNDVDSPWCVQPDAFKSQLQSLRSKGYETILPSDLAANHKWGKPLPLQPVIISFDDGDAETLKAVEPVLKSFQFKAVAYLITSLVGTNVSSSGEHEGHRSISWPEMKTMQKRGVISFGGHSHEHRNLAATADPFPLIDECRKQLLRHGANESEAFCYPFGQYRPETVQAVKRAGFRTAVVCEDRIALFGGTNNILALPRVSVMGGRHEFSVFRDRPGEPEDEIIFTVRHEGIPVEIAPALKDLRGVNRWMDVRELPRGDTRIVRKTTDLKAHKALYTLDIWDKHKLFCFFAGKIRIELPAEPAAPAQ